MATIVCKRCGSQLDADASVCSTCAAGAGSTPKSNAVMWALLIPAGLLGLFLMAGTSSSSPEADEKALKRRTFEHCMKELRSELTDPGAKDLIRAACAKMKDDFIQRFGREP